MRNHESFSLDEWLQWISGTDTITKDNDPIEVLYITDSQEETVFIQYPANSVRI